MKGGRMSSVNILGTCVCRDIFGFHENDGGYKIDRFIQSVNPVSVVMKTLPSEDRFQAEVTALSKLNNFYKRCLILDYTRQVLHYLAGNERSDWLVMDLGCVRDLLYDVTYLLDSKMSVHSGVSGQYISAGLIDYAYDKEQSDFAKDSLICKIRQGAIVDVLDFPDDEFYAYMDCYINEILKLYREEQIILVDIKGVFQFVSDRDVIVASKNRSKWEKENRRIEKAFCYVRNKLTNVHVIDFPVTVVGDKNHKWGVSSLHYVKEYYDYALEAVDLIVDAKAQGISGEEEKLLLRHHYDKYTKILYDRFDRSLQKYVKQCNVEKDLKNRFETYEKYFLKVLIHENPKLTLITFFYRHNIRKCAVYGFVKLTKYFLHMACPEVEIEYIVENNMHEYDGITCISREEKYFPETDAMIICDVINNRKIRQKLDKMQVGFPCYDMYEIAGIV